MIHAQTQRDGDLLQVHPDERPADVQPGVRTDVFDRDGIGEGVIGGRCEGAARLGLRHDIDDVHTGDRRALRDQRAVQMLAALRREEDPAGLQLRVNRVKNDVCHFGTGVRADAAAADLTGGAADDHELPLVQFCFFTQQRGGLRCLLPQLVKHGGRLPAASASGAPFPAARTGQSRPRSQRPPAAGWSAAGC